MHIESIAQSYTTMSVMINTILDCSHHPEEDLQSILRAVVEIAVAALKRGKSSGVDHIPAELVQARGDHDRCFHKDL